MSPTPIEIPRTRAATNHAGPSRFLDLSAEIRAMIMANIFESAEPIRLEMKYTLPDIPDIFDDDLSEDEEDDSRPPQTFMVPVQTEKYRDICKGITLFLTCRQLYHEAATILYSNNTFVFVRSTELSFKAGHYLCYKEWCLGLGSQMKWLRKVHIDVYDSVWMAIWRNDGARGIHSGDLTALAELICDPSMAKCVFEVVKPREMEEGAAAEAFTFDPELMNKVFKGLCADRTNLKRSTGAIIKLDFFPFARHPSYQAGDDIGLLEIECGSPHNQSSHRRE
ncbi:hypothetical protein PtrSN002B_003122 [Pyrenophora tritici-repentis]|uniref:DUF7730 domain-containing protein n=1 Tax=Pyrenophora tritici-repentis TaxID=45151 RepID=A0A2W1DAH6_9PLEO|nr:hypothetical protein PtrM4_117220 [Pyrenophora tritici-repentis]KAI0585937.1 hypothetical protein Alg215_02292 [Pyrenophora tritici-repentis]KAI1510898.1 hypothetical protein Ptr86124_010019 [Pyrenophora tritici-repentis]KAI1544240.1 hypothetical protein PtrSN001A_002774 [Pyrenophora tritici-repentis]KAI1555358.1 hypothetical protein PtrSN002B_003122 [Pyrenophora tritici-repentis]